VSRNRRTDEQRNGETDEVGGGLWFAECGVGIGDKFFSEGVPSARRSFVALPGLLRMTGGGNGLRTG